MLLLKIKMIKNMVNNIEFKANRLMTPEIFKESFDDRSAIVIADVRFNVYRKDMEYIYSWVDTLTQCRKSKTHQFLLSIEGYDDDVRELYEIEEVRSYMTELFNNKPEFFHYICEESRKLALLCIAYKNISEKDSIITQVAIDPEVVTEFLKKVDARIQELDISENEQMEFLTYIKKLFGN